MRIMVYSLLWVMQDFYHQPYVLFALVVGWELRRNMCIIFEGRIISNGILYSPRITKRSYTPSQKVLLKKTQPPHPPPPRPRVTLALLVALRDRQCRSCATPGRWDPNP